MAKHNELGRKGEELAIQYLKEKNYEILERNWRNRHKEIDIVAKDGKELVIVEVKTRESDAYGEPFTAVSRQKQTRLICAANAYIFQHNLNCDTRFDIISIIYRDGNPEIEHIEDAFLPQW